MTTSGTGTLNPLDPITNQGYKSIRGMSLRWLSNTTFQVTRGQCRDSGNVNDIVMGATLYPASGAGNTGNYLTSSVAVTVNVAVNGAGGLDVGTVAASTMYAVYAIGDSRGFKPGSAVVSTNWLNPSLPFGYDSYRYIGAISVDGSSHIRKFVQTGTDFNRTMLYDPGTGPSTVGVTIPSSGTSGSATYVNVGVLTTLVPQWQTVGIDQFTVLLAVGLTPNAAGNAVYLAPPTIDDGTTATVGALAVLSAEVTAHAQSAVVSVPANLPNATQQSGLTIGAVPTVLYATTSASDAVTFTLVGYVD